VTNTLPTNGAKNKHRFPWLFVIISTAMLALTCCALLGVQAFRRALEPENGIHVEQLRSELEEALPIGTPYQDVVNWVWARELPILEVSFGDLPPEGHKFSIPLTIPNSSLLESATIYVYISFDESRRLETISVERFVYAL
jgi:hypothetical protein